MSLRVLQAFADESFREATADGFYVLASVVFEQQAQHAARTAMLDLRGKRATRKLHWNEMNGQQQRNAAKTVADFDGLHVVTVGSPVPARRQERARATCLSQLIHELHGLDVRRLVVEARTEALNLRDINTARGARYSLPKGSEFRVDHLPGFQEPLMWAADVVAGAVRAHREGRAEFHALLEERLYEVEIDTRC